MVAFRAAGRPGALVLALDIVPLGARIVVVVDPWRARLHRVKWGDFRHLGPPWILPQTQRYPSRLSLFASQFWGCKFLNFLNLARLSGAAAFTGGLLRFVSAFNPPLSPVSAEGLWDLTDVCLTLGLIGIYLVRAEKLGFLGLAAFALSIAALSFIGGPDADPFGFSTYQEGAAALIISLIGLSIAWIRAGERPLAPPALWFGAAIAGGVLGALPQPLPSYGFLVAGCLFGAAFMAAGWDLMRRKA